MSQGLFCDTVVFFSDAVQGLFGLLYAVLGLFFNVQTPLVDPTTGSLFGCNL